MHKNDENLSWPMPDGEVPLEWVEALLRHADLSARIDKRVELLRAVHHASHGRVEGLELVLRWVKQWDDAPDPERIIVMWNGWPDGKSPATFTSLCEHVQELGLEWIELCASTEPGFEPCQKTFLKEPANYFSRKSQNPLAKYSVTEDVERIRAEASHQQTFLAGLAVLGQSTVIFGEPGTGKTVLSLRLLFDDVRSRRIDPQNVSYLNLDDNLLGLSEKAAIARESDIHMISEGRKGFESRSFPTIINGLIEAGQCRDLVIVLDTTKKVVDIMDKRKSALFGGLMRRLVLAGATVIALAHTNKRRNLDNRPIYAGTSDILEDFDCAWLMYEIDVRNDEKIVHLENLKNRGNVLQEATFAYSIKQSLTYRELFDSVRALGSTARNATESANSPVSDADVIEVTRGCIAAGVTTKMRLRAAVAEKGNISRRQAQRVIERYTGTDPGRHHWRYLVGPRGAKVFSLLSPDSPDEHD